MKILKFITTITLLFIFISNTKAGDVLKIVQLRNELNFDGIPSEPDWQLSEKIPLKMHFPVYGNLPSEESDVRITYDKNYLWVGAKLYYKDISKMGLIINRGISYCNEIDTYPAIDTKYGQNARMKPSLAETVAFENIASRNPVYIAPYLLTGFTRDWTLNENGTQYVKNNNPDLTGGLDVKYNINSNLTLDFTANTDFAQVEADDETVNLTRYSLSFPEKRLFFQERASIFNFELGGPQALFYSRNIGISHGEPVRILGGARMVGRIGKWDVGFLDMNTARFNGILRRILELPG